MNEKIIAELTKYTEGTVNRDKIDNRGYAQYINLLFNDENPQQLGLTMTFELDSEGKLVEKKIDAVEQFAGGLKAFFSKGSKMLDLGSGVGNATQQLQALLAPLDITVVGIDASIPVRTNQEPANLVGGDFANLPFADKSIDRILACETFPRWYGDYPLSMRAATPHFFSPEEKIYVEDEDGVLDLDKPKYIERIQQTWDEIARIAAPGCIYRGTLPTVRDESDYQYHARKFQPLLEKGWRVVIYSKKNNPQYATFVAYLPDTVGNRQ